MNALVVLYSINGMLLLLHEIESAYEKEWEILRLPGGIAGFLGMHVPVILLLFYGVFELAGGTRAGGIVALVSGVFGLLPTVVHEVVVKKPDRFHRISSRVIIYGNFVTGLALLVLSIRFLSQ